MSFQVVRSLIANKEATINESFFNIIYVDTQHDMRLIHSGTLIYDISDHLPIFLFYGKNNKHKNKPLVLSCRSLNDSNMKLISDQLKKTDFSFLNNLNVDYAHEAFTNLLTQITDTYAPLKEVKLHPKNVIYNPWMTPALLQSTKTLNKLYMIHQGQYIFLYIQQS